MKKEFFRYLDNLTDIVDLKYYWLIFLKNKKHIIIIPFLISLLTFLISLNAEKQFVSKATLVVGSDADSIVNIQAVYANDEFRNRVNNQMAILKSDEVIEYILSDKKIPLEFNRLYAERKFNFFQRIFKKKNVLTKEDIKGILRSNFSVSNIPSSDVLELSFVSSSSKISQLALINIIDSYQRYEIDTKINITNYANKKISLRLKELAKQMDISEKKLSEYKKKHKLVDTGNVKKLKIEEIQAVSLRIIDAEAKLQEQENDLTSIQIADGDIDALLAIEDIKKRTDIINIKDNLTANQNSIDSLMLIYTSEHPKVQKAYEFSDTLKSRLKKILDENIEQKAFELTNLKNFIASSEQELESSTTELRLLEEKETGMLKFSREVNSNRDLYESFLQRVKETNEEQNLQVSKIKIIEIPSLPKGPISPKPKKNAFVSFWIAVVLVYSLVFYREVNSAVIKSPEALDYLEIPQITVLPKMDVLKRGFHLLQIFLEDSESNFSESIRNARTVIESKFKKNKSYLITSSNPSEGKTTFAFNLALSLEKNNKVLFIEADIRRPSVLNSFYKFDKEIYGLGEIISGSKTFEESLILVPGTEQLQIITSGEARFDMSDIVKKEQLEKFLKILALQYDYVIIDSPPVQPVSDTLILTQSADYNLFVVRSESTRTLSFLSSIKKIKNVAATIDGLIINDLDLSKHSYYGYYYNYDSYYYRKT